MAKKKARWMQRADTAFSKVVREVGYCESDRETHKGVLQCAHIIGRSYKTIRVDRRNALCLCAGCHMYFTHHPLEWRQWIDETRPGLWAELNAEALAYAAVDWKSESVYWESQVIQ